MSEENRNDPIYPSQASEAFFPDTAEAGENEVLSLSKEEVLPKTPSRPLEGSEVPPKDEALPKALSEAEGSLPKDEAPSLPKDEAEGSVSDGETPQEASPRLNGDEGEEIEGIWSKGCRVKLEIFEGPLDLLLFLIRREEIDIYDIPITNITDQYMEYLDIMRLLDLDIASDFLVMAATLIYIKSRMLLPPDEREEEEEEEYDPRMDLVRQLLEYRKFKDAASTLQAMELEQEKLFPRAGINEHPKVEPASLDANIFDLLTAFGDVLKRSDAAHLREIVSDRFTVADRILHITKVLQEAASITFDSLFRDLASRSEIVVTFLALLELVRTKEVLVQQESAFGAIQIIAQAT